MFTTFDKAIAGVLTPAITTAILSALGYINITGDMTIREAVIALVTGAIVWLVPNKKKA